MKMHFLYSIVTMQIVAFQFIALRFLSSIPDYVVGDGPRTQSVEQAIGSYRRWLRSWSYPIGLGLWGAMTLCAYVLPFTKGVAGLLAITAVSILSSGFFVWTYFRARSAVVRIAEEMPDTGRRVASLERRSVGDYYNVAWEFVPFAILAATAAFTVWALPRLGQPYPLGFDSQGVPDEWGEGVWRFLALLLVQGVFAFGLLALTFAGLRRRPDLSPAASAASLDPAKAARVSETVRKRKLRFLMAAKVAFALQFGLMVFVKIETALGVMLPPWVEKSPWAPTLFALALYAVFMMRMARGRGVF